MNPSKKMTSQRIPQHKDKTLKSETLEQMVTLLKTQIHWLMMKRAQTQMMMMLMKMSP